MIWVANTEASSKPDNKARHHVGKCAGSPCTAVHCRNRIRLLRYCLCKALCSTQNSGLVSNQVQLPRDPIENIAKQLLQYLPNRGRGLGFKGVFCRLSSASSDRWNQLKFHQAFTSWFHLSELAEQSRQKTPSWKC